MNRARTRTSATRGLTLVEVLITLSAIIILLSLVMPALARGRGESGVARSLANLQAINAALESYAGDFDGRQPTAVVDDFGTYGATGPAAITNYNAVNGMPHPPVLLGEDENGAMWGYYMPPSGTAGNYVTAVPIGIGSLASNGQEFGFFRLSNAKIMHDYVGRRWFDPAFYAPNDAAAYSIVGPWLDVPDSPFGTLNGVTPQLLLLSSYCFSPAAMFGPQVLASTANGGYTNPYGTADGFRSPHVTQAKHPAQKTRVMEHAWCQNTPENRCNPAFSEGTYAGCEPYYFNHGAASAPATLFFDGSTRLLPNSEVLASDAQLIKQTGEGVWHRGTPFGANGYRGKVSYDGTIVSHHILTIDGILGRDTLGPTP